MKTIECWGGPLDGVVLDAYPVTFYRWQPDGYLNTDWGYVLVEQRYEWRKIMASPK